MKVPHKLNHKEKVCSSVLRISFAFTYLVIRYNLCGNKSEILVQVYFDLKIYFF